MEESKDTSESFAEKIIRTISLNPDSNQSITKEAAVEVLYPQLAKLKAEVRMRSTDAWIYQLVSAGEESHKIGVKAIAAHLKKINFSDNLTFWKELDKQASVYKAKAS
jgi:hypothetical protein